MKGWMQGEPWPSWKGWEGSLAPSVEGAKRGCGRAEEAHGGHRMGKEYTHWQERKRERWGGPV